MMSTINGNTELSTSTVNFILSFDEQPHYENVNLTTDKNEHQIKNIIDVISNYPMDNITRRYMKDNNIDACTAAIHELELKRFLTICSIYNEPIGMRGEVDELWHTFIMFTGEYAVFCDKVAGYFIHHVPNDDETSQQQSLTSAIRFNLAYEKLFKTAPPSDIWPDVPVDCRTCGKGCVGHCGKP